MIEDFFFFFLTSAGASSASDADDEEAAGDLLSCLVIVKFCDWAAAAFFGLTYLTLTKIFMRNESGLGRVAASGSRAGIR